jgi:urease accessory protein
VRHLALSGSALVSDFHRASGLFRAPDAPGCGRIAVERSGSRSVVTRAFATSPLRLLTPGNHGRAAWIYTSNYGGGLVDGDRVELDVEVGAGAAALLATQASTKVYRSPNGTTAELTGRVGRDALLIVAPDPVVCFAAARYRQAQRFDVQDGSALIVVDCMVSGRRASGERWAFADYQSLVEVTVAGRLLVHDALALRAVDGDLSDRLGRFDVLALAVIVGRPLREEASKLVADSEADVLVRRPDQISCAWPLGDQGCVLRVAGTSAEQVGRALRRSLRFVPALLGDDPWRRRW